MVVVPSHLDWVTVKTTLPQLPYLPSPSRRAVRTERLLLRPPVESDLDAYHVIRSQPEVMRWTGKGVPDADAAETWKVLSQKFPPNDAANFDFAICLVDTGELIGLGGSHERTGELGWPVIGYLLHKDAWGKGYATEFLKGFLEAWWELPRSDVELKVERDSVQGDEVVKTECISAVTHATNMTSKKVLTKCGMQLVKIFPEKGSDDFEDDEKLGHGFTLPRPEAR